jgi:hypothetical protein
MDAWMAASSLDFLANAFQKQNSVPVHFSGRLSSIQLELFDLSLVSSSKSPKFTAIHRGYWGSAWLHREDNNAAK